MTKQINLDKINDIFRSRRPGTVGKHSFFSVLVPLVQKEGQLCLLYEVRAEHMKRQPGEICFPGGQVEAEESFEECAVRETVEELGIDREDIQIIAQMDVLYTYSDFTMFPFLGTIKEDALLRMNCNPDEVKETFLVPVSWLMGQEPFVYRTAVEPVIGKDFPYERINFPKGYKWRKGTSEVPIYDFENRVIWGLTGRITRNFIEVLKDKEAEDV